MVRDTAKGKDVDATSGGPTGTFEDPHKLVFSIKDLSATSVVLYPDQAEITRDIPGVQLKPGVNEVTIKDLTGYCQEHSIKVEGKGDAIITDMVVESVPMVRVWGTSGFLESDEDCSSSDSQSGSDSDDDSDDDPDFAEVRKLDEEIKDIRSQAQDAAEQWKNADAQLAALERYGATITAEVAVPETMTQFLDAYQESRKILYEQHKTAKEKIARLEKELRRKEKDRTRKLKGPMAAKAKIAREKAKERAKKSEEANEKQLQRQAAIRLRPLSSYRVKVMVETNIETEASLTLRYLAKNASWFPRYDLRLDSISNSGQIVYRAHFENKTYETWRDAKITFSSSAQTFGGLGEVVPTLTPWTLSLQKGSLQHSSSESDSTAGLYSIKEQQALRPKGTNLVDTVQHLMLKPNQQQLHDHDFLQQKNLVRNTVNAIKPTASGLFGQPLPQANANGLIQPQQASGLFGQQQQIQQQMQQRQQQMQQQLYQRQQQMQQFQQRAEFAPPQGSTLGDIATSSAFGGGGTGNLFGAPADAQADGSGAQDGADAVEGFGDEDTASTLAPIRASMLIAESSSSESYGMTTTYEIAGLKTIRSSPIVRRQVISTIDLPTVTFRSIAVVKLRPAAFLKARFKNTSKHVFLRGSGGLTVDGSFLGQTTIPHCAPDDTISLSLGVDTGVHISYAKPTLVSSSQGFISKENVTLYKRSIFIHNAKSQPLTLTVLDQVPVSEDERLRVQVVNPKALREGGEAVRTGAPGSTNLDNKWGTATAAMKGSGNGEITYTVKLEKGRSCKLPLEYEVKLPAGEKIVGLT